MLQLCEGWDRVWPIEEPNLDAAAVQYKTSAPLWLGKTHDQPGRWVVLWNDAPGIGCSTPPHDTCNHPAQNAAIQEQEQE